jgi:hypothetical protein
MISIEKALSRAGGDVRFHGMDVKLGQPSVFGSMPGKAECHETMSGMGCLSWDKGRGGGGGCQNELCRVALLSTSMWELRDNKDSKPPAAHRPTAISLITIPPSSSQSTACSWRLTEVIDDTF